VERINSEKINKFMDDIKNTLSKLDALSQNNTSQSNKHLTEGNTGAIVKDIAGKAVRRAVPVVGTALSWDEAYDRWKQGDRTGAVISGLAGGAYLIPGVGLAAGTALDAANVGRDIKAGQYDDLPQQAKDWYDEKSKSVKDLGQSIQNAGQKLKSVDGYVSGGVKENTMKNIERKSNTKNKVNQRSLTEEEQLNEILGWLRNLVRRGKKATPTPRPTPSPTSSGTVNTARPNNPNVPYREVPGAPPVTTDLTGAPVNPGGISATGSVGAKRAQAAADTRLDSQRTAGRDALDALKPSPGGSAGVGSATGLRPTGRGSVSPSRTAASVGGAAAAGGGLGYALSGSDTDSKKTNNRTDTFQNPPINYSAAATAMQGIPPSADALPGGRPAAQPAVQPAQYTPVAATQPAAVSPTSAGTAPATTAASAASPTSVDSSDSSATPAGGNSTYSLTANNSTSPQGSVLSPGFATRTGPFQFTDAQKQWLGGANPQDPYIIARMRRAVGGPLPPVDYFKNPEDQAIARQLNVGRDNLNRVRGAVGSKPLGTDGNFPDQNQPPPAKKPRWQPTEPLPTNLESVYPNKRPLNFRENRHSAVNRLTRKFENYIENKFNIVENNYVPKKKNLR